MAAKYIYYEKINISRRGIIIFSLAFVFIKAALGLLDYDADEITGLLIISMFSLMMLIYCKRKTIGCLFLFIPIWGMICSLDFIVAIPISILLKKNLYNMLDNNIYSTFSSLIILLGLILYKRKYCIEGNAVRKYSSNEANFQSFELKSSERNIISCNGILLFLLFTVLYALQEENIMNSQVYLWLFTLFIIIISILILSTVLMMIRKSVSTNYYKVLSKVNEHYLQAQLNHFEAYRKSQVETRRIRHDMKNHLLCMVDLYDKKEFAKLGEYIHSLNDEVVNINKELFIGNDIADAIINEKNERAKEMNIKIQTEGSLGSVRNITPIDICTIFANALDNAMEAMKDIEIDKRIINICIRKNKSFLLIAFTNPVDKDSERFDINEYQTSKEDKDNHGFGIENIKLAAEKYQGDINCSIIDDTVLGRSFLTEVMLKI